jgi:hypothetical protein
MQYGSFPPFADARHAISTMKSGLKTHPVSNYLRSASFPEEAHTSVIFRAFYR